jgi:hypothetical protein
MLAFLEVLASVAGAMLGLVIYGRYSNDAAREQNRRNLASIDNKLGR